MQARMPNPAFVVPGAMDALYGLSKTISDAGLDPKLSELINLRASQINRCGVCSEGHCTIARRHGETDERLEAVLYWRHAPYFTDAERAVLALTECVTRLSDRDDPVPDAVWHEAARHYDEQTLGAIIMEIAVINVWNRLNVTTHQLMGEWKP
ncbi:carboxymuconolactone decarboxylase family protein [bacterium]|nr:carboxymuconolactone decarboxylase family protein [bacterium]